MFWYCAENFNNILFLTLHFIIPWKELERGGGSPPSGNHWPGSIFPVDTIKPKLLIRSICQHKIISSLLFTSHSLSLFFLSFMTVLGWLIANKHIHNEVCQHTLSEIKDSFLKWKEMPVIGWSKISCWKANWVINQSAAWSVTVLCHITVWLLALYLGLLARCTHSHICASMYAHTCLSCNVIGGIFFMPSHLKDTVEGWFGFVSTRV